MLRVSDLDKSIQYYTEALGMKLLRKKDNETGKYTLAFLSYGDELDNTVFELTYNWSDPHPRSLIPPLKLLDTKIWLTTLPCNADMPANLLQSGLATGNVICKTPLFPNSDRTCRGQNEKYDLGDAYAQVALSTKASQQHLIWCMSLKLCPSDFLSSAVHAGWSFQSNSPTFALTELSLSHGVVFGYFTE